MHHTRGRKREDAAAPCLVDLDIQNITVHYYAWCYWSMTSKRKRYGTRRTSLPYPILYAWLDSIRLASNLSIPSERKKKARNSPKSALKKIKEMVSQLNGRSVLSVPVSSAHRFAISQELFFTVISKERSPRLLFRYGCIIYIYV